MKTFIFLLVTLAISASSGVNGQVKPYFISLYEEASEILPVPKECPKVENPKGPTHIAHETDCDKFYKCSNGEKVLMRCQPGLHFNPRKQVCDYPANAGCELIPGAGSSSTTTTTSTTPTPPTTTSTTPTPPTTTSTTPTPPTTTSTTPTPPTTTSTTPTPPTTTSTTPTPPTTTSTTPTPPTTTSTTPTPPTTTSTTPTPPTTTSTTPTPITTTTTEATTPSYPTSCPANDPKEPIVLPHECVCEKYYKCRNGDQILKECSPGLQFNPTAHKCDLPINAGCVSTPAPTTPKPIIPGECPLVNEVGKEAVHLPHETKCSFFYKCDNRKKVLFECPDNLHFNPEKQVCDWQSPKMCKDKSYF